MAGCSHGDRISEGSLNFESQGELTPRDIARELFVAIKENQSRNLVDNQVFLTELYSCIDYEVEPDEVQWKPAAPNDQFDTIRLIHAAFCLQEFKRAEFLSRRCESKLMTFLHFWARLRKAELDARGLHSANNMPFSAAYDNRQAHLAILKDLEGTVDVDNDGYLNFVKAKLLLQLRKLTEARDCLLLGLNREPCNWMAWSLLHKFVTCKEHLNYVSDYLHDHWMKRLFLADVRCSVVPLAQDDDISSVYQEFLDVFTDSSYILTQMAIAQQNQRQVYAALQLFNRVRTLDPYRLDQLDVYSNLLYVRGSEVDLTYLAYFATSVNKYCKETCAVVANFFALRGQHEKAVEYYRRALKLDPEYSQGWTLLGHECVEVKDTTSAIEAYRQACHINENDYYAWYGLGQLFEVLKMPYFALRYHQKAHALRPSDSRIVVAMGDCYQKIGKLDDAKKCYYKAYQTGDIEGMVLHNLAKLHEELNEHETARECYRKFLDECEERRMLDVEELGDAFLYLARAHLKERNLDEALIFAQKCFIFGPKREESKMVIKEIAAVREKENEMSRCLARSQSTNRQSLRFT